LPIPKIPWITDIKEDIVPSPLQTPITKQAITSVSKITGTPVEDEATLQSLDHQDNKRPKNTDYYSLSVKRLKVTPNSKNKKKI